MLKLARLYPHKRDERIIFDEAPHKYYIDGETDGWTSVTTVVHEPFDHFNSFLVARGMVRSSKFPDDPKYAKYQSLLKDENGQDVTQAVLIQRIMKSWEENGAHAAQLGTYLHNSIEKFYNDEKVDNETIEYLNHFMDFVAVQKMVGLQPFRTEWVIFSEEHKICGSIDMIMVDPETKQYHMFDWKRYSFFFVCCSYLIF